MITVAKYISKFLEEKNIKHVFGYQGGAVMKVIAEVRDKYIQNYHEQASAFCADGYSRVNNEIGVAISTSGPGATNMITGIANAYCDSIPVLFITGQDVLSNLDFSRNLRTNGYQDVNIVKMVEPITKYALTLTDATRIRYELEKCFYVATSGRKGPVLIDIPSDIQACEIDESSLEGFLPKEQEEYKYDIDAIRDLINNSAKPLILVGGGVKRGNATDIVDEFSLKTQIPVITTLNGRDSSYVAYGFSGMHGHVYANLAIKNADLILALGTRFGIQQAGKNHKEYTNAKIIHVDVDEFELNRTLETDINIKADVREFVDKLNKETLSVSISDWLEVLKLWKDKYYDANCVNEEGIDPVKFVRKFLYDYKFDVITTDVGQNQLWVAQGVENLEEGQSYLTSSGLGSMGYAIPAAIGASYVKNNVVAFCGDGGLQMNLQELQLIASKNLNIKIVVFNNKTLGKIKEMQLKSDVPNFVGTCEEDFSCLDLSKIADLYGISYKRISQTNEVNDIGTLVNTAGACIIDVEVSNMAKLATKLDNDILKRETIKCDNHVCV